MKNSFKLSLNSIMAGAITILFANNVDASDQSRKRQFEDKVSVSETQQEIKKIDYLSGLPEELIMKIMGYLTFGELDKLSRGSELFRRLFHGEIQTLLGRFYNTNIPKVYVEITNSNVDDILKMMKLFNKKDRGLDFFKKTTERSITQLEFRITCEKQSTNTDLDKNKTLYTNNPNSWANFCMVLLKEFLKKEEFTPKIKLLTSLKEDIYKTNASLAESQVEHYRKFLEIDRKVIDLVFNQGLDCDSNTQKRLSQIQFSLCKSSSDQSIIESFMKKNNIQEVNLTDWYNGDDEWIKISNKFNDVVKEINDLFNRKKDSINEFTPGDLSKINGKSKCPFTIENKTSEVTPRIVRRLFQLKDE